MSAEQFSPDSFDPINLEAEIEAVRSLELRDFTRLKVDAKLGDVVLGCLYYQPEEATDDTPIGIVKGLGAPRAVYLGLAEAIAKRGRPAFIYKAPRKQPLSEALSPEHLSDPLVLQMTAVRYAMQALHNSERVTELRGDNAVTQIDLAGHSMGNYIAVGAAYHDTVEKPNENVHVRTLTSVAGASLDSYSSFKELRQPGEGRLQQM
ncbi:MAG TPA: hypothetical protein VMT96_00210, partial [Candidatus Bathyarchaeia archaeon]|nr:hypothetical protein [Candidatus Bathyarchaeia archaeon]